MTTALIVLLALCQTPAEKDETFLKGWEWNEPEINRLVYEEYDALLIANELITRPLCENSDEETTYTTEQTIAYFFRDGKLICQVYYCYDWIIYAENGGFIIQFDQWEKKRIIRVKNLDVGQFAMEEDANGGQWWQWGNRMGMLNQGTQLEGITLIDTWHDWKPINKNGV